MWGVGGGEDICGEVLGGGWSAPCSQFLFWVKSWCREVVVRWWCWTEEDWPWFRVLSRLKGRGT
jgi:hypothetical protein